MIVSAGSDLDDLAAIHHGDPVGEMRDDRDVVRDEEVRDAEPVAQIGQQVDDRGLHRDVERRDRLVADDELRVAWRARGRCRRAASRRRSSGGRSGRRSATAAAPGRAARRRAPECPPSARGRSARSAARAIRRTVLRGLSDEFGFWNTICAMRRIGSKRALRLARHGFARDADRAGRRFDEAQDRAPQRGLAGAGFADQPEHFARRD